MPAFVFLCDMSTETECLDRKLFGASHGETHKFHYSKIAIGDTLFLYNLDTGFLRGPYKAGSACTMNIEPTAWKKTRRSFPWQVRTEVAGAYKKPLGIDAVSRVVPVTASKMGMLPPYELTDEQATALVGSIAAANP